MAMVLPGSVGQHLRRGPRLDLEGLSRQAADRPLGGFADLGSEPDRRRGVGQERDRPRIANVPQGRGRVGRQPGVPAIKNRQQGRDRRAVEATQVADQPGAIFGRDPRTVRAPRPAPARQGDRLP